MISKIKSLYKKIKLNKILKIYKKIIDLDNSTIILPSFFIDVRDFINLKKRKYIKIGKNSLVGCILIFEKETGNINIGDRTYISAGTKLISINSIEVGDDVTIAWGCTIYDHNSHSIYWDERKDDIFKSIKDLRKTGNFIKNKDWSVVKSAPIKICNKVWIGFDVVILKGVIIGEGSVIAARSVVTKDVAPYTVVAGNPAKIVKNIERR